VSTSIARNCSLPVDPVEILDHQHLRPPLGCADQQAAQGLERLAASLRRVHGLHVVLARVDRQQARR
jgi:hypothetical protein